MKLVRYVGTADRRVIKSSEFAEAGLNGIGDMVFAKDSETDFYRSVSDLVAIFLLSQGDFVCEDGATIFDIFQNAVTSGTAEVLSVNGMDGEVVLPGFGSDASAGTAAMRKLGRAAGKALAGDDALVTDALTKQLFTNDNNMVLIKKNDGTITAVQLASSTVLGRKATGEIIAMTAADIYGLISGMFGGEDGLALDDLSDVSAPGLSSGGYVLGTTDGTNWSPVVVGDLSVPDGIVRTGTEAVYSGSLDATVDLTTPEARKASTQIVQISDDDGTLTLDLPDGATSGPFAVAISFSTPRSGNFALAHGDGDDLLISDPFSVMKSQPDRLLLVLSPTAFVGVNDFGATWMVTVVPEGVLPTNNVDLDGYYAYVDRSRVWLDGGGLADAGASVVLGDPLPASMRPSSTAYIGLRGVNDLTGTPALVDLTVVISTSGVLTVTASDPGVTLTGQVAFSMAGMSFRK